MKFSMAIRWALVTVCCGITCGTLGHYLQDEMAFITVASISAVFGLIGTAAMNGE